MPMREECKHFQSRTYASGEVARFCVLDLAPEAPWKCPDDCPSFVPRLADVGWNHGSLVEPAIEPMPDVPGDEAAAAPRQRRGHRQRRRPRRARRRAGRGREARQEVVAPQGLSAAAAAPCRPGQRPVKFPGRFSMKAAMASIRSSDDRNAAFQVAT